MCMVEKLSRGVLLRTSSQLHIPWGHSARLTLTGQKDLGTTIIDKHCKLRPDLMVCWMPGLKEIVHSVSMT